MRQQLEAIRDSTIEELAQAEGQQILETLRVKYLGRKDELASTLKQMGGLSAEERLVIGQLVNQVCLLIGEELTRHASELKDQVVQARLEQEELDVILPNKYYELDAKYPLSIVLGEIREIFIGMGLEIVDGPKIEYDYYSFETLNILKNHPVHDTQDAFYISDNIVLRTQTSPVQVCVMEKIRPPIRTISPGRVYRSDAVDATYSPLSHQIEGLVVDEGVIFTSLKDTPEALAKRPYGEDSTMRFRPHHFPFIESFIEVDVQCSSCHGEGCRLCKGEGQIEILGCDMVRPEVLPNCGIDLEVYSDFAPGMGLGRVVMRRYNIDDLRPFYENDIRFLKQFQEMSPEWVFR